MLYDSDARDFCAAVGFRLQHFEEQALQNAIVKLKTAGIWDQRELFYVGAFLDVEACLFNVAHPYKNKLTPFGEPLRGGAGGYSGDMTGGTYLETGFDLGGLHDNYSETSASIFAYLPRGWSSSGSNAVIGTDTEDYVLIRADHNGGSRFRLNNSTGTIYNDEFPSSQDSYFLGAVRNNADSYDIYAQGLLKGTTGRASTPATTGNHLRLLRARVGSSHGNQVGIVWLGGALSEGQVSVMYDVFEELYLSLYHHVPKGYQDLSVQNLNETMTVRYFRAPTVISPDKIIVSMHGTGRGSIAQNQASWALSSRYNAVVVSTFFDKTRFSNKRYHSIGISVSEGVTNDPTEWSSRIVQRVYNDIRGRLQNNELPVYVIGHSAGGQFCHRMALFDPLDVVRFVSCNSGSYTQVWEDFDFNQGLADLPENMRDAAALAGYVSRPLTIYIGTDDTATPDDHPYVPGSEGAMAQGGNRYERAQFMYSNGQSVAEDLNVEYKWTYVEAPNIGHSSYGMYSRHELDDAFGF